MTCVMLSSVCRLESELHSLKEELAAAPKQDQLQKYAS